MGQKFNYLFFITFKLLCILFINILKAESAIIINHLNGDPKNQQQAILDQVRQKKIMFGHQSVGNNIINGLKTLAQKDPTRYQIKILNEPGILTESAFAHWQNGSNYDPAGKITAFDTKMRHIDSKGNIWAASVDIAFFKFCYVDFYNIGSDMTILFNQYITVMEKLSQDFPNCKFVHVTTPLFALRYSGEDAINVRRHQYNELLRDYVKTKGGFLFDLADLEAHDAAGVPLTFQYKNQTYPVIWYVASNPNNNGWSYDGGHLNASGEEYMALALWNMFATMIESILPVSYTIFEAKELASGVELRWETASEDNNFGFEIQRSLNGIDFNKIAFIPGNGTSSEIRYYRYVDTNPPADVLSYRLKQIDYNGDFQLSSVIKIALEKLVIKNFHLEQNYPNPFNPMTYIHYQISAYQHISLKIYDQRGRIVQTLFEGQQERGEYVIPFNATYLSSGEYFYELKSDENGRQSKKMLLVK